MSITAVTQITNFLLLEILVILYFRLQFQFPVAVFHIHCWIVGDFWTLGACTTDCTTKCLGLMQKVPKLTVCFGECNDNATKV